MSLVQINTPKTLENRFLGFVSGKRRFSTMQNQKTTKSNSKGLEDDRWVYFLKPEFRSANLAEFKVLSIEVASGPKTCAWAYSRKLACTGFGDKAKSPCLETAGNGRHVQVAGCRSDRADLYFSDRVLFYDLIDRELAIHQATCKALGQIPVVRLDTFSSLWLWQKRDFLPIMHKYMAMGVVFYDYVKAPIEVIKKAMALSPDLDLSISFHEQMHHLEVREALKISRLVVPFDVSKPEGLPKTWRGFPVINGDRHDLRFIEKTGIVIGLCAKVTQNGKPSPMATCGWVQQTKTQKKAKTQNKATNLLQWPFEPVWENTANLLN